MVIRHSRSVIGMCSPSTHENARILSRLCLVILTPTSIDALVHNCNHNRRMMAIRLSLFLFSLSLSLSLYSNSNNGTLSGQGPQYNEAVTINGKPVKAVVGQGLKQVASSARVKIAYNCNQGDCGTCMVKVNGRKVKACQTNIPTGKCAVQTLN